MFAQTQDRDSLFNGGSWDDRVHKLNHLIDIVKQTCISKISAFFPCAKFPAKCQAIPFCSG